MLLSVVEDSGLIWQKALKLYFINGKNIFLKKKVIIYFKAFIHQDPINAWREGTVIKEEMFTNAVRFLF